MPTIKELKKQLDKAGVEYDPKAKKSELEKLVLSLGEDKKESAVPAKLVPEDEEVRLEPPVPRVPETPKTDPDYLRQYQYKKVDNNPTVGGVLTDPDPGSKAEVMKKSLLSQQKVGLFIPRPEKEDPSITLSVNLNGYRLDLPKNVYIDVPLQIAEVVRESLNQQAAALLPYQIGRSKAIEEALS